MQKLAVVFGIIQFGVILLSCNKDVSVNSDTPSNPFRLVPDSGVIGSRIKIIGKGFSSTGDPIRFTGTTNFQPPLPYGDTLIVVDVPFGAISGPITIITTSGEKQTSTFTVTENCNQSALTTTSWNLPATNTPPESCPNSDYTGVVRCWEPHVEGDTLTLILANYHMSSTSVRTEVFKFRRNPPDTYPVVVSLVVYTTFGSVSMTDTLKSGLVKIKLWNPPNAIEGEVFPDLRSSSPQATPPYLVTSFKSG